MRFILLQARNPNDLAKIEEQQSFAQRLNVDIGCIHSVDILQDELHLDLLLGSNALLVGGAGEYSVLDNDQRIKRFISFLGEVSNHQTPTFASCFGFQALVLALGGQIVKDVARAEVGTYLLKTTVHAQEDVLFSAFPNEFWAQLGHQDQASVLPESVIHLASSERTHYQAFKVKDSPIYATQFHPELTESDNRKRFARYMPIYGALFGEEEAQRRMDSHRPSIESNQLLLNFKKQFCQ